MNINGTIFKELVKRGYSIRGSKRVWDVSDSRLWYLTPELSEGFLNLKNYVPYRVKVIDTEFDLIEKNAEKLKDICSGGSFNLIDLGCGDGTKAAAFIKKVSCGSKMRYCPVDVSQYFIDKAVKNVGALNDKNIVEIKPVTLDFGDFEEVMEKIKKKGFERNVVLLLGETISHYDANDLLFHLSAALGSGDFLIVGNGYRIWERFVELDKYKEPLLLSAMNKWFVKIMEGLSFNMEELDISPRFENGRLEWYYMIKVDKELKHNGHRVHFRSGDEVVVAAQNKFYEPEWKEFCEMYFNSVEFLKDEKKEYALFVCRK